MKKLYFAFGAVGLSLLTWAEIPAPWTPVAAEEGTGGAVERTPGTKVSVWGRDYVFGKQAMPTSVVATGDELLAGPIRIVAAGTNGAAAVWTDGGSWVEERTDESVTVCAHQSSDLIIADVIAKIEYDGMMKCTLTALPQLDEPAFSLTKVWLEIPLKPEFATLRATFPRPWGNVDNAGGVHQYFNWPFKSSVWIGNEEKGLNWFCESDEAFVNDHPQRVIEVIPGEKETVLRIRFCDHFVKRLPLTWTFGLQATPVKPYDRSWNANHVLHKINATGADGKRENGWLTQLGENPVARLLPQIEGAREAGAKTVVFHEDWIRIQNDPASAQPVFKEIVKACHDRGLKVLVYLGYEISSLDPQFQELGDSVIDYDLSYRTISVFWCRKPAQRDFPVCYRSKFAEVWLARAIKAYDTLGIDGYYLDGTIMPCGCVNAKHGCGWTDVEGKRHETYPIFAVREMMKKLFTFVQSRGGVVNAHQSGCVCAPTLAFCHSYWDGEQLAYSTGDIRGMLDLEVFRAEFMGRNHGVPCEFLSAERPGKWTYADALAVTLLHDVFPRPNGYEVLHYLKPVWKAYDDFDASKAEWRPYWKQPLAVVPDSVKASVYLKDSQALIVAANVAAKDAAQAEIALPAGMTSATDALTGQALSVADGKIKIEIAPFGHALIRAK